MNKETQVNRRNFLKVAGLTAAVGASFGFGSRQLNGHKHFQSHDFIMKPVNVSSG